MFLDVQTLRPKSGQSDIRLPTVIKSSLTAETPTHPGDGPFWALNVLASLTVLSDSSLFSHPTALKFILPFIAQARGHKRNAVRLLHPQLWKCLLWDFLRMSKISNETPEDIENLSSMNSPPDIMERAFLVIKQELYGGIGVAMAASLLRPRDIVDSDSHTAIDPISKVLAVVDGMVCSDNSSTYAEGIAILNQLLNAIGSSRVPDNNQWSYNDVLPDILFDGSLLHTKWSRISVAIQSMAQFQVSKIRHLSEPEIIQHWDSLAAIWVKCINKSLLHSHFELSVSVMFVCRRYGDLRWNRVTFFIYGSHCYLFTLNSRRRMVT